jgi:hypothetical protein
MISSLGTNPTIFYAQITIFRDCHQTMALTSLGHRVVYAIEDLDAWAAHGIRRSTSDPGVGTVFPAR